ncbi:MAG: hypothetical protein MUQ32_02665 [Chloroflexi bacterium]|nr:hypothetical protein [Chloroflexota bacterium]
MIGAKAVTGNGLMAQVRHGHIGWSIRRLREQGTRTRAEQVARTTLTAETRYEHAELGAPSRDGGATPLRWNRLT